MRNETPAEEVKAVDGAWTALLADVRAARSLDPSSPEAKAIAVRWDELLARTMSYYARRPELTEAVARHCAAGGFDETDSAPRPADFGFIRRVKAS